MDSLRGSSVKIGMTQRRLVWFLRKDDMPKSRSVNNPFDHQAQQKSSQSLSGKVVQVCLTLSPAEAYTQISNIQNDQDHGRLSYEVIRKIREDHEHRVQDILMTPLEFPLPIPARCRAWNFLCLVQVCCSRLQRRHRVFRGNVQSLLNADSSGRRQTEKDFVMPDPRSRGDTAYHSGLVSHHCG